MRILHSKKTIALAAAALAAAVLATAGLSGVWAQVTHADTVGGIHLRVFSTSVSGFDSGWHTHPGLTIVQVREGSLQLYGPGSCTPKTVGPGETYVEVAYFPGRAVATGRAVWTTTQLLKAEDPGLTPVASPCP